MPGQERLRDHFEKGFVWMTLQRQKSKEVEKHRNDFNKLRDSPQPPGFWQEFAKTNGEQLAELHPEIRSWVETAAKEGGVPRELSKLAGKLTGVECDFDHRIPLGFSGGLTEEQIHTPSNLMLLPVKAHHAFDAAFITRLSQPGWTQAGEKVRVPVPGEGREAIRFYQELEPLGKEGAELAALRLAKETVPSRNPGRFGEFEKKFGKSYAEKLAQAGDPIEKEKILEEGQAERKRRKELGKQAEENPRPPQGPRGLPLGEETPTMEKALGASFGKAASLSSVASAYPEAQAAFGEAREGKAAEALRDGASAGRDLAYAASPFVAFFRQPGAMLFKRLPLIGGVLSFGEAAYDGYRALRSQLSGNPREAGDWAKEGLWRAAGAAGNLALWSVPYVGLFAATGASVLAERRADDLQEERERLHRRSAAPAVLSSPISSLQETRQRVEREEPARGLEKARAREKAGPALGLTPLPAQAPQAARQAAKEARPAAAGTPEQEETRGPRMPPPLDTSGFTRWQPSVSQGRRMGRSSRGWER
ncbi:MAG: hypothetical protein PHO89_04645 [Methylacidiphilaceae bacterium]|nr:hypothetical protein [Candidatus Methylacidiphilaceae bacterium]